MPGRPRLARLVYRILPDQNSLVIATERREIGMLPFLSSVRDIERLAKAPTLTVTDRGFEGIGPINWLAFNCGKKPLDDVRVRRAIALAANRDFITGKLLGGVAKAATGPIVPGSPFYEPAVDLYKLDIAKADALLEEAGLKKGRTARGSSSPSTTSPTTTTSSATSPSTCGPASSGLVSPSRSGPRRTSRPGRSASPTSTST
ncbi:ABC transporter substrate-binding protein [Methylobacterium oryzae CBMB20]